MTELQKQFAERFDEKIEHLKHLKEMTLKGIPDLSAFPVEAIVTENGLPRFGAPFDRTLMVTLKKHLESVGWVYNESASDESENKQYWYPNHTFDKDGLQIEVVYFDYKEGSTCTRKKIGTVTVEEEVFEFTCE